MLSLTTRRKKDEILRLAYVGITRAVQHCYWYVDGQDGQAANGPKASDRVAADKPFLLTTGVKDKDVYGCGYTPKTQAQKTAPSTKEEGAAFK